MRIKNLRDGKKHLMGTVNSTIGMERQRNEILRFQKMLRVREH